MRGTKGQNFKKMQKRITKNTKGITLIALVVTIIILLILAGVSIAMLTGNNGILSQAGRAKDRTREEGAREKIQLEVTGAYDKYGNINVEKLKTNLENNVGADTSKINDILIDGATTGKITVDGKDFYVDGNGNVLDYDGPEGTDKPEVSTETTIDRSNGTIDVVFLQNTSYAVSQTPNAPALDNTMVPVKYNTETKNWIVCSKDDAEWYNYEVQSGTTETGGSSKWANVMLTDDIVVEKDGTTYDASAIKDLLTGNNLQTIVGATVTTEGSMLVWVPRYAYRITYKNSSGEVLGYSDSRGIVTKDGKAPSSYQTPTTSINVNGSIENTKYEYYRPHPAFETDLDQGGWSSRLTGIWVGKFEATGSTSEVTVKSSLSSLRCKTIGTFWQSAKDNFKAKTSGSHMMKNSEWGAVAYLTESKYGRNTTAVKQNTDLGNYTGGASTAGAYKDNILQSTTGNVYGIYDTVGGACEYVASYIANNQKSYGYQFASNAGTSSSKNDKTESTKYATVYKYNTTSDSYQNNYDLNLNKVFGDGTTETSTSGTGSSSWHSAGSYFVSTLRPFFIRGGSYNDYDGFAGSFSFNSYSGDSVNHGFRAVCVVK